MDNDQGPIIVTSSVSAPPVSLSALKGGFFQKWDNRFFILILLSFFAHGGLVYYLRSVSVPKAEEISLDKIPERFVRFIIDKPLKKPKESADGKAGKEKAQDKEKKEDATTKEAATKKAKAARVKKAQKAVAKRASRAEKKIRNTGLFKMLAGVGGTARGPSVVDVLGKTGRFKGTGGLDQALDGIRGLSKGVTAMDAPLTKSRGGTSGKEDISGLIDALSSARSGALSKKGNIVYTPPEIVGDATNTAKRAENVISRVVKKQIKSIKFSYERELKRNPTLAGKITVRFTIEEDGTVSSVEIVESTLNSPSLENVIARKIKRWKFDALSSGSGSTVVTYPFVFQPS